MTFVPTLHGWHAVSWDGAQALIFTSRDTRWVDVPDHVIMVRQVWREEYAPGRHYSNVFYGSDWIWLNPDGRFSAGKVVPNLGEVAKEGILLPEATYEPLRLALHEETVIVKTRWSRP